MSRTGPEASPTPTPIDPALHAPPWIGCERCGLVSRNRLASVEDSGSGLAAGAGEYLQRCPRCESVLHAIKPYALQRTWACTLAAAVLYVPANALPVMETYNQFERSEHTLLGGIHELWVDGSWALSVIVFIASIAVPVLKIVGLAVLAWSVTHANHWRRYDRSRLYRLIEAVGHWSMLDVYVVVILAATVRWGSLASVTPGSGLLSFAGVVVLTMVATYSFDPKLIWLGARADEATERGPSAERRPTAPDPRVNSA